jgi:hypothetical protein
MLLDLLPRRLTIRRKSDAVHLAIRSARCEGPRAWMLRIVRSKTSVYRPVPRKGLASCFS